MQKKKVKRIGIITAGMTGGGTERVIAILANYLCEQGYEIHIIMTANQKVDYFLNNKINVVSLGSKTQGSFIKRIERITSLRKYFKNKEIKTILSFGTETNLYTLLATRLMSTKVVVSERNDPNQCGYPKMRNILYYLADALVFQTEEAQLCFPEIIQRRGHVIPNPISDNLPDIFCGERKKNIVAVGRLENQKNQNLLIRSFSAFNRLHPEYQLEIYGIGALKAELEKLATEQGVKESVIFRGFSSNVLEEIKDAGIYVLSSDYEGVSNSLMEAMAMGIPVISTDCPIGGSSMLIKNGINGILVPVKDEESLTKAMIELVENKTMANNISRNAIEIRNQYKKENICRKWEKLIY